MSACSYFDQIVAPHFKLRANDQKMEKKMLWPMFVARRTQFLDYLKDEFSKLCEVLGSPHEAAAMVTHTTFINAHADLIKRFKRKSTELARRQDRKQRTSSSQRSQTHKNARSAFLPDKIDIMRRWIAEHADDPYPDIKTKAKLAEKTGSKITKVKLGML